MKKYFLFSLLVISFISVFAQENLNNLYMSSSVNAELQNIGQQNIFNPNNFYFTNDETRF